MVTLTSAQDSGNLDDGPISTQRPYPTAGHSDGTDTGFHYLGGLYDENNELLTAMRKCRRRRTKLVTTALTGQVNI